MGKLSRIKKIHIHREGTHTLIGGAAALAVLLCAVWFAFDTKIPFYILLGLSIAIYSIVVNFFRCPIRRFQGSTNDVVVAPADGKVVVIEEVDENEYFHDRRIMVSIFMSLFNVHANWFPVDGFVRKVEHQDGNFRQAYLPKASLENERSSIVIETPRGEQILVRQIAGAVARRIVTYATEGEECYIDQHLGFIKFGSRVDIYLPLGTPIEVKLHQATTGNATVIAHLGSKAPAPKA